MGGDCACLGPWNVAINKKINLPLVLRAATEVSQAPINV